MFGMRHLLCMALSCVSIIGGALISFTSVDASPAGCRTYGPSPGGAGRKATATCTVPGRRFVVRFNCHNDDWDQVSTGSGNTATAPYGVSSGYCPFGSHPWVRWVIYL